MPRKVARAVLKLLVFVAALYLLAALMFFLLQRWILFPRYVLPPAPEGEPRVPGLERWWHETDAGRIEAWWIPGDGASAARPGPAVIFTHGNAELIDFWPDELAGYRRLGVGLLLPEYRGYGRSAGAPSQAAITADLVAWRDRLAARADVDPDRIVYHGRSIGGGAACSLAAERPPRAQILQSTFTSIGAMAAKYWMPGFLARDPFDNLALVDGLAAPVLVIHGRQDDLVPFSQGQRLAAAAADGQLVAYDCDHNSCPPDPDRYWADLETFLRRAGLLAPRAPVDPPTGADPPLESTP